MRQDTDRTILSVPEAAERLGITPDAIRARLHRGTLEGEKQAGQWRVFLPSAADEGFVRSPHEMPAESVAPTGPRQDSTGTRQDAGRPDYAERYAQLERENERLWAELEARTEEIRRRDHIIAGLVERLPALAGSVESEPVREAAQTPNKGAGATETTVVASNTPAESGSFWGRVWRLLMGG